MRLFINYMYLVAKEFTTVLANDDLDKGSPSSTMYRIFFSK